MKKKIWTLFAVINIVLVYLVFSSWVKSEGSDSETAVQQVIPYQIKGIDIPDQMTFAGEQVPVERIDVRERLDRELLSNSYFHSNTLLLIKRANRYFPMLDTILRSEGVPADFKYLALIESSLDPRAISPMGAVGIWQFLKSTGKDYGLEVDNEIDERYHIEKSTRAACEYFKKAYEKYGSWTLVAASYNIGQRRISEELSRQKVDNYYDLLLVDETSRYVFRILAIKEIFKDPVAYGFNLKREDLYPVVKMRKVVLNSSVSDFGLFAREHDISYGILKEFNPWLRDSFLTNSHNRTYVIDIPVKSYLTFNKRHIEVYQQNWVVK
ncbi:lytic transglycosylase domain-containing protein [Saccharicrinis sp. FJH54]|uniref:lytic transglycosylase domain-containing protein n=1 Tax=Saccharicrinis sp. FJH54 TaxID=3344665 RepID=UPI0035D4FBE1